MIGCAEHSPAKMRNGQPQKIIGPQYAVTIATNTPEQVMTSRRARLYSIRDSVRMHLPAAKDSMFDKQEGKWQQYHHDTYK